MSKKTLIKDPVRVSIVMERSMKERIQRQARAMSVQENKDVSFNEMCRRGFDIVFPDEQQELNFKY